jgi:hypothetical protein
MADTFPNSRSPPRTAYVVAAVNAPLLWKHQADAICTGVADQTPINNALINFKTVHLSQGTFTTSAPVNTNLDNIILEGEGFGTIIQQANGVNQDVISCGRRNNKQIQIKDLLVDGNKGNNASGRGIAFTAYDSSIDNVYIQNCPGNGFDGEVPSSATDHSVDNFISRIRTVSNGGTGFIWGTGVGGTANDHYFRDIVSHDNIGDGVNLIGSDCSVDLLHSYSNGDNGVVIQGSLNHILRGFSEVNGKEGFLLFKGGGFDTTLVACMSKNNSTNSAGTYNGFNLDGGAGVFAQQKCTLLGCMAFDSKGSKTQGWGVINNNINAGTRNVVIGGDFTPNLTGSIQSFGIFLPYLKAININSPSFQDDILSGTFPIDSIGVNTVTIAHGLDITPRIQDCYLSVLQDTAVDDWAYNLLKVVSTGAINVIAKINVSIPSITAGATARLGLRVGIP